MNVRIDQSGHDHQPFLDIDHLAVCNYLPVATHKNNSLLADVNRARSNCVGQHHSLPTDDQIWSRHLSLSEYWWRRWPIRIVCIRVRQPKHLLVSRCDCAVSNRKHQEDADVTEQHAGNSHQPGQYRHEKNAEEVWHCRL